MSELSAEAIWERITKVLDEQLQYGILEQAKAVVDISLDGSDLTLTVATEEALEFFRADVNQQRLKIVSRPIISLQNIFVKKADAAPLSSPE